jgi:hypothetical protein
VKLSPAQVIPSSDISNKELFTKRIIGQIMETSFSCEATTSKHETELGLTVKLWPPPVGLIRVHVKRFQWTRRDDFQHRAQQFWERKGPADHNPSRLCWRINTVELARLKSAERQAFQLINGPSQRLSLLAVLRFSNVPSTNGRCNRICDHLRRSSWKSQYLCRANLKTLTCSSPCSLSPSFLGSASSAVRICFFCSSSRPRTARIAPYFSSSSVRRCSTDVSYV